MKHLKQVNIVIGRFQPLTLGHLKCVEQAWKLLNIPTVICMINTPDNKVDERHPFPTSLTLPIYKDLIKDIPHIEDIVLVKNADIVAIGDMLKNMGFIVRAWSCGSDRIKSYTDMAERYGEKAGLDADFEMIEIERGDEDISATKVRKALADNNKREFYALTPYKSLRLHLLQGSVFDIFRKQLLDVIK